MKTYHESHTRVPDDNEEDDGSNSNDRSRFPLNRPPPPLLRLLVLPRVSHAADGRRHQIGVAAEASVVDVDEGGGEGR